MDYFWDGAKQAWDLITSGNPYLIDLIWVTLKVAGVSTGVGLIIGLPIGLLLGLGRFRGRGFGLVLANAGLGLPPVIIGLTCALLMFPQAPLGRFHLFLTLEGVYVAQSLLALPIIIALSAAAVQLIPSGLIDQARALNASRPQIWGLAIREARVGIMAAAITAVGSAMSEVGAVVLVGGNIIGVDQTLASAALQQVEAGHFVEGLAIGIILLGLILVVTAFLTIAQHQGARVARVGRAS